MIRQALVALGPRTVLPVLLLGSAALALGPHLAAKAPTTMYRLVLHAPAEPDAFYLSAWAEGEVLQAHDGSDHRAIVFTRRAEEHDGCSWLGVERLVPLSAHLYQYSYRETVLACRPDAVPFCKTPREGLVTVEKYEGTGAPTALFGVQRPADMWNDLGDHDVLAARVNAVIGESEATVRAANQDLADALAATQAEDQ